MKDLRQADRGVSMRQQYQVTDLPKSGFPLVYNSHVGGIPIGRMIPGTYQYLMPGDKFAGRNEFSLIAEKLVTPVISDVKFSQHNYFVTLRSVDRNFEDLQTPTNTNSMSANLSTPMFSLLDIVIAVIGQFQPFLPQAKRFSDHFEYTINSPSMDFSTAKLNQFFSLSTWVNNAKKSYIDDAYEDLKAQLAALKPAFDAVALSPTSDSVRDFFVRVWHCIFDFYCGEGSLMDYFNYPIVSHHDVKVWLDYILSTVAPLVGTEEPVGTTAYLYQFFEDLDPIALIGDDWSAHFDNRLVWEYPLRAYYAIWYEHYRNMWLEPRNNDLPDYKLWGSTPLLTGTNRNLYITTLLVQRIRPWTDDPFNTNQIDDMCRHVYAPVLGDVSSNFSYPSAPAQVNEDEQVLKSGNVWSTAELQYIDSNGVSRSINCPLPQALSNAIPDFDRLYDIYSGSALDLFAMKKAKMLERFLKRNFAFGDEYRDRQKAQYGVTIEDYRINRPHYLSGSVDNIDIKQEVANGGSARPTGDPSLSYMVQQGDRLVTATASSKYSDGFEFFATEFGVYICIFSVLPLAQYDHTDPILFTQKFQDFPIPVFAQQQEDISNSSEMYRVGICIPSIDNLPFGHVPYAHGWRYRIDEVHGQMLSSKFDYNFARFFRGNTIDGIPKLNYKFIHCRPNLPMFLNNLLLDGQFYGTMKHNFWVERLLPQPVEVV